MESSTDFWLPPSLAMVGELQRFHRSGIYIPRRPLDTTGELGRETRGQGGISGQKETTKKLASGRETDGEENGGGAGGCGDDADCGGRAIDTDVFAGDDRELHAMRFLCDGEHELE